MGEYFPCPAPEGESSCKYFGTEKGCHEVDGHRYFYSPDYTTTTERTFRNLPENIDRNCRRFEEELHAREQPPEKPPIDFMKERIALSGVYLSVTKRKRIFGNG